MINDFTLHTSPVVSLFLANPNQGITRFEMIEAGVDYYVAQAHIKALWDQGCIKREGRRGHYTYTFLKMPHPDTHFYKKSPKQERVKVSAPVIIRESYNFEPFDYTDMERRLDEVRIQFEPYQRQESAEAENGVYAQIVLEELEKYPQITRVTLRDRMQINLSRLQGILNQLIEDGKITAVTPIGSSTMYVPVKPDFGAVLPEGEDDSRVVRDHLTGRADTVIGIGNELMWPRHRVNRAMAHLYHNGELKWVSVGQLLIFRLRT